MFGPNLRAGPRPQIQPFAASRSLHASAHQHTRYKTLPTRPRQQPTRYKTLPTRPKRPISASFARAGRTLYRIHPHDPQQGELCTAPSAKPGTKLSKHAPTSSPTGTKLSQRPVLQRFREKVRRAHPTPQQNREEIRPALLKTAFFASFAPAGRIFSRSHPHQAEQGELIRAEDLTGRYDGATLKPPTPLFTVDRPRSSHRLYSRHPRPRTRAPHNECHHNETRIRLCRFNRRVGGTSALLMPPTRYVESNSRKAQASLGATSSSASPRWICPLATGVTAPNFFLFVTTTGVMVS